jgi:pyruvate/2-oxoglutarate dehydrogenase complex dihydrolipoamide acyltransferase (E2) component
VDSYEILKFPKSRVGTFDVGKIGGKKHHIVGLIETDVTLAREKIREQIRNGSKISFNSWVIKIISSTLMENRNMHAINYRKNSQIAFNDIDISIPVEKEVDGKKVPLAAVIRKTNVKSITEIYNEIEKLKKKAIHSEKDYVLGKTKGLSLSGLFFSMPQFIRLFIWRILLSNPFTRKKNMGTVMITNAGASGIRSGWIIPKSIHNLCFAIGSIALKPWIYENEVTKREIMNLTIMFDHDVVDGVPAARFTDKLVKNIEKAYLL